MSGEVAELERARVAGARESEPREPESPESEPRAPDAVCLNCSAPLGGEYCQDCGERRADGRDLSLRHFAGEAVREFTSLEHSKLFRTIFTLLFKPGRLPREYFAGRKGRYLKPLNLFLAALAVSFLLYSYAGPRSAREIMRFADESMSKKSAEMLARRAAEKGVSRDEFVARFGEKWQSYGGLSIVHVSNAVLFSVLLWLVHLRSGRYFVEHLVFSVHFITFSLIVEALVWPAYLVDVKSVTPRDILVNFACTVVYAVYLFFALRAFYGRGVFVNVLKTLALCFGFVVISVLAYLLTFSAALDAASR